MDARLAKLARPLVLALALAALATGAGAQPEPATLTEAVVIEREAAVEVWVRLSRRVRYEGSLIDSPWRLVLDFEGTTYRWALKPVPVAMDPVRELRGSQYRVGVARLVIELRRKVAYTIDQDGEGLRIVLPREGAAGATPSAAEPAPRPASARPAPVAAPAAAGTPALATPAPAKPAGTPAGPPASKTPAPAAVTPGTAGLRVHGIIVLDAQAHAYVFDPATRQVRRYAVGDALGDGVVETVGERHVVVRTPSGRVELRVEEARPARAPR